MALRNQASLAALLIGALAGGTMAADAGEQPRIAFFGFSLINTSLEPTKPVEEARLQMLDVLLEQKLGGSGHFRFVTIPLNSKRRSPTVRRSRTATGVSATSPT